jgi:predicted nucleic acid-binding Zn ribbon protein
MQGKRANLREPVALGRLLDKVLDAHRRQRNDPLSRIWEQWQPSVGLSVAANTRPVSLKGGCLLVCVSSSVWLQELQFLKNNLVDRLNALLEEELVHDIRFKIGPT